eukprot:CAMPEP_0179218760 /NCGR_PEP_ID=MMETSP0797-20121207/4645_1 /TAXON_ID=47934 /ORGANISM="Dinophysis acuminata, Strain DAEP01" /LENGTH=128 /DNA_ID=CAMNT_0020925129 /DNA_START=134 /DNA_END=520 /DNA_ORIENTATION=-
MRAVGLPWGHSSPKHFWGAQQPAPIRCTIRCASSRPSVAAAEKPLQFYGAGRGDEGYLLLDAMPCLVTAPDPLHGHRGVVIHERPPRDARDLEGDAPGTVDLADILLAASGKIPARALPRDVPAAQSL